MKKLALILAFMIIPCTAFGLEMLADDSLDNITGQDGVSIIADDIQLFLNVDLFAYADTDGYDLKNGCSVVGCGNGGAMFAAQNVQMDTININAIIADTYNGSGTAGATRRNPNLISSSCGIQLFYDYESTARWGTCITTCNSFIKATTKGLDNFTPYASTYSGVNTFTTSIFARRFIPQALSIDITDQLPTGTQAYNYISTGFTSNTNITVMGVLIGLPTLEIHIQDIHLDMALYDLNCETNVVNGGDFPASSGGTTTSNRFGEILIQGVTFSILSGWVEIAPH
jgi:hypothetical protein